MSVLHITCKHWLGHVTVRKAGVGTTVAFLSSEIRNDIALNLPAGAYIVRQSEVAGKTSTDYSAMLSEDSVLTLEIAWKNSSIATIADQEKVRYDGVSAELHYAFGIKHGNCFLGDVRHELPLLDSIVLGVDISFVLFSGLINEAGDTLTLTFSKNAYRGTGYTATSLNVDTANNNDIQLSYVSGEGTQSLVFALSTIIQINEVVNFDFDGFPDCIVDDAGISLNEIADFVLVNESIQSFSDLLLWDGFDGSINGSTYKATNYDYPAFHTAVISASGSLSSAFKVVGSKSLRLNGGSFIFSSAMPSVSAYKGRCGLWARIGNIAYGGIQPLLQLQAATNANKLILSFDSMARVLIAVTNNGKNLISATVVPSFTITAATWFFIELS